MKRIWLGRLAGIDAGTRLIAMPGARMRRNVTMKLRAPIVVEMPRKIMPSA